MALETHWTGAVMAVCAWQQLKQRHRHCPHCNVVQSKNQTKSLSPKSVTNGVRRGNLSVTFLSLWSATPCICREKKKPKGCFEVESVSSVSF